MVKIQKGNVHTSVEQILPKIARTNVPRLLLENLKVVRKAEFKGIKTLKQEEIEDILAKELKFKNENALNQLRDQAKGISEELGYQSEYKKLSQMISALLSTHADSDFLKSPYAKALVRKEPYDSSRLKLFEKLYLY